MNGKIMNKNELILKMELKLNSCDKKIKQATNLILDIIANKLSEGGRAELRGFGAFAVKKYDSMKLNPKTREKFHKSYSVVRFRPGKELRERVNNGI